MSDPLTNEQFERESLDQKISELSREEIEDKYSNNFAILEEDYDSEQSRNYKKELKNQLTGFSICHTDPNVILCQF